MTILWTPTLEMIEHTNMDMFRILVNKHLNKNLLDYNDLYQWSITDLNDFWLSFWKFATPIYDGEFPINRNIEPLRITQALIEGSHMSDTKWFPQVKLNYAENLLLFAQDSEDDITIVFANEQGIQRQLSYIELKISVTNAVIFLNKRGIKAGDRIAGYLPNMPEAVIWMHI